MSTLIECLKLPAVRLGALVLALVATGAPAAEQIPRTALKGQKVAPCADDEYEKNGSCWKLYMAPPGSSDQYVRETCEAFGIYEWSEGDCVKNRRVALPVWRSDKTT